MKASLIFVADKDEVDISVKRTTLLDMFTELNASELEIVILEIESWYLAGASLSSNIKFSKSLPLNTENISKEQFCTYFERLECLEAKIHLLEEYDLPLAKSRNSSLNGFLEKYCS